MLYLLSGLIIGAVMGLTGAGGALIAIPLFMQQFGMSLKEASVLSLFAVVIASLSNFISQRKFADLKNSAIIVLASSLASFLSNPYKKLTPDVVVAIILTSISIYALYSVWKPREKNESAITKKSPTIIFTVFIGLFLGVLTTFTGLGGGVLMMAIFLNIYGYDQKRAVATSLLAVSLSSLSSLVIQLFGGVELPIDISVLYLVFGILASAFLLKYLMKKVKTENMIKVRQVVFSLVVIIAILKIF